MTRPRHIAVASVLLLAASCGGANGPGAIEVAAGMLDSCALRKDHSLVCWGSNESGELGLGTSTPTAVLPTIVAPLGSDNVAVAAHSDMVCAIKQDASLWCWGNNDVGTIGNGSKGGDVLAPTRIAVAGARTFHTGGFHSCAVLTDGTIACWGANAAGQLGDGTRADHYAPAPVQDGNGVFGNVKDACTGQESTCAVKTDGSLWCWGDGGLGTLGLASLYGKSVTNPVQVDIGVQVDSVACDDAHHDCAVDVNGSVWCWGLDGDGEVGQPPPPLDKNQQTPVMVPSLSGVKQVSVGPDATSCALKTDGTVWCWGENTYGELGNGSSVAGSSEPVQVLRSSGGPLDQVTQIAVGGDHTCALRSDGTVWCWGSNGAGELGSAPANARGTADEVLLPSM